ncbi:MAG: cation:proton antiporter [Candidatus Limnocylindrales bacterium]
MNELIPTLAIVLLAAEGGALLAHLAGLPRVVGQIGAGIVLGPSLAGLVSPDGTVEGIAQLGALAILGIAGLETNLAAMRHVGRAAFLVASGGVILPFVTGLGLALAAGLDITAALFVGAILTATSVGITAATLQELGLMHTRAAITILAAAIIDDVLGLIVLSLVVSDTSAGSNLLGAMVPMGLTILGVWVVLRWMPVHLGRAIETLHLRGGGLAAMLGLVLAFAWAVQTFGGLAGITGAYVAGLALSGSSAAPRLRDGLIRAGEAFCVPVFFVAIGLAADLRAIGPVLPFALGLLVVAVLAKLLGSAVAAAVAGMSARESGLVGIGMIARGEVALVAATVGLRAGAIGPGVYAAVVLVSVATTVLTPLGIAAWSRVSASASWHGLDSRRIGVPAPVARLELE